MKISEHSFLFYIGNKMGGNYFVVVFEFGEEVVLAGGGEEEF